MNHWHLILLLSTVSLRAQGYTTLVTFNGTNGAAPGAPLIQGSDGNYYGTTGTIVGSFSGGTIFRMTPAGVLTTIYTFGYANSSYPNGDNPGSLIQGTDGNFYGTANSGGPNGFGTVFKLTPSGVLTTLYSFSNGADGAYPSNLLQASDGNFYGVTYFIGNDANIFKITPAGVMTKLYQFGSTPTDGQSATSLIQARDGNLYGTTPTGGTNGKGSFFRLTLAGALTTIYSFAASGGPTSPGSMIQGADGNFYGTTTLDGGVVFKVTPSGQFTILSNFVANINLYVGYPNPLMQASDGNFYGTTYGGGDTNRGVVFEVTPLGAFRSLFSFPYGGGYPTAGLIQGSDGNLYGTTSGVGFEGAREDDGTIFRVPLPAYTCTNTAPPVITSVNSASSYGGYPYFTVGSWLEIKGTNLADPADPRLQAAVNPGQWTLADFDGANAPTVLDGISASVGANGVASAAYISYLSPTQINVQAPGFYTTGTASITVTNCNATSAPFSSPTQQLAPGFLAPPNFSAHGTQYMAATFVSDGAYVLDPAVASSLGVNGRPAKPGDLIVAYGVGFGGVTAAPNPGYIVSFDPGSIVQQSNALVNPVAISFGSAAAALSYAGLAGGFVGLYEFYMTVPLGLANGDYRINAVQNGTPVPQSLYLTVRN